MEIKVLCRGSEAGHSASDLFCSLQEKKPNVFLVYRGPTGSVPWTAVGFVFSGAFEAINEGGSDEHLMLGNGLKYLRSIKIEVNWFPYLQTLLPKFHDVEELGPPECWAVVVVVPEWWWPWQISQVFLGLIIIFGPSWCCRGLMVLIWAAMGRFLSLFSLASSSSSLPSSLAAVGAAADRFSVTEFAVDRWTTRRGPLGGVEDQLSSTFSGLSADAVVDRFLLVSLQRLEHRAKRGGKNDVECHFPSRFSNYFRIPLCGGLKFGEQSQWLLEIKALLSPPFPSPTLEALLQQDCRQLEHSLKVIDKEVKDRRVGVLKSEERDRGQKELEWRDNMRFEVTRLVNM
uniref:Uncharacterized protein n=1 Tax=Fagus sylvatica TaxID=28930 RepID=A0A2N9FII6_FAGSY